MSRSSEASSFEGDQVRRSALHLAAFYGVLPFVEFLVGQCEMDPEIKDALGRTPIQLVTDAKDPAGHLRVAIAHATRQRRFRKFTSQLLDFTDSAAKSTTSTMLSDLERLTQTMSSVRDVRVIFNVGVASLSENPPQLKELLVAAFTRIIEDKLVVDDREAMVFKMVLRECKRRELFSEAEVEEWDLKLVKVNMESATWVQSLKRSVSQLEWRTNDLHRHPCALKLHYQELARAVEDTKNESAIVRGLKRVRHLLSVFSVLLSVVGVDGASEVLDSVVDFSEPLEVLADMFLSRDKAQLRATLNHPDTWDSLTVRSSLQPILREAEIDPMDLAKVLREVALLDEDAAVHGQEAQNQHQPQHGLLPLCEPGSNLELFPFHFAVRHSDGDITKFVELVQFIDEEPGTNLREAVAIVAVPRMISGSTKKWVKIRATPAVYASYLGFVEIVKSLLDRPDFSRNPSQEKRCVTIQHAYTTRKMLTRVAAAA